MSRDKILFLVPSLGAGGAQRQILAVMRNLPARFETLLCVFDEHDVHYRGELPAGEPRYGLGGQRIGLASFRRLVRILREERPAILHSYLDNANFWGRLAALCLPDGPQVVTSVRARMMEPRFLLVERLLARRSQQIVVNSIGIRDELVQRAGVPAHKIRVIHNVLDLEFFRPPTAPERTRARAQWGCAPEERVILVPGRISLQKHQVGLLLAFEELRHRGLARDATLLLAGGGRDATVDHLVARLADRPLLRGHVRVLGAQRDIRSLYWAADLLVLTSLWEGLPNTALEGCACGLPALLSHAANLDGIVDPGVGGWEAPTGDRMAVARSLAAALACSPQELRQRGARAHARVAQRFDTGRIRGEMEQLYDELLARR